MMQISGTELRYTTNLSQTTFIASMHVGRSYSLSFTQQHCCLPSLVTDVSDSPIVKRYVMVIYTGGTIGMKQGPDGETRCALVPMPSHHPVFYRLQYAKTEGDVLHFAC